MQNIVKIWNQKWLFGAILAFVSAVLALLLANISQFEIFELKTYDARFELRGQTGTEEDNIVLVTIDDQTFLGLRRKWPFPRDFFAKAILNLSEAGAKLIVLDVEFTDPDKDRRRDLILAGAVKRAGNVILAGKWVTEYAVNDIVNSYILRPMPLLLNTNAKWGIINVDEDPDGFIRRYLLFQNNNGRIFYPLSLTAFLYLNQINSTNGNIKIDEDGDFVI
ncbi:MAG: CHASE2 domain-containing protein, partial [bacterium]